MLSRRGFLPPKSHPRRLKHKRLHNSTHLNSLCSKLQTLTVSWCHWIALEPPFFCLSQSNPAVFKLPSNTNTEMCHSLHDLPSRVCVFAKTGKTDRLDIQKKNPSRNNSSFRLFMLFFLHLRCARQLDPFPHISTCKHPKTNIHQKSRNLLPNAEKIHTLYCNFRR